MINSTSSILNSSHLTDPSLTSIISFITDALSISFTLIESYHSYLYTVLIFISTILTSFWIVAQSRQFRPLTDIRLRPETLTLYFTTGLSCSKALHINLTNLALNWTTNGAKSDKGLLIYCVFALEHSILSSMLFSKQHTLVHNYIHSIKVHHKRSNNIV